MTYVIHLLGTYVTILIFQETVFQDQVLKSLSLSKKQAKKCKFIKTRQLAYVKV